MDPLLVSTLAFVGLTLAFFAVLYVLRILWIGVFGRLNRRNGHRTGRAPVFRAVDPYRDLGTLDASFGQLVASANVPYRPRDIALIMLLVGVLLGGIVFLWFDSPATALAAFALGVILPIPVLAIYRERRRQQFRDQFPELLGMLARSLRGGMSVDQAIEEAGQHMSYPWGPEFRICARQMSVGLSVQSAVGSMLQRVPISELRNLLTLLSVHRQTGGNLSIMLERLAVAVRDRLSFHRQFRSMTTGARLAVVMMAIFWLIGVGYILFVDDTFRGFLREEPEAIGLVIAAIIMQVIGLYWVSRIMRVDY